MRSVVVVFPASICAIMPMFRVFSSGNFIYLVCPRSCTLHLASCPLTLPSIVGKRPIRLGHFVKVFPLLDRGALSLGSFQYLGGQSFRHPFFSPGLRITDQP